MFSRDMPTNLATVSRQYPVLRNPSPADLALGPPTMQREPGTPYGTVWFAPTPLAGQSNPRTAGTRTVHSPNAPR
jgi:hypothetical protein